MKFLVIILGLLLSFNATAGQESNFVRNEIGCLARTAYWEARGEGERGMRAVAHVIINRRDNERFPSTICSVVNQNNRGRCQFSTCRFHHRNGINSVEWDLAQKIARSVYYWQPDITNGALYFHARHVRPSWRHSMIEIAEDFGNHRFYREE